MDELKAENERLKKLIQRCEFLWGGFCPWCGCHGRHNCYSDHPCPAFSDVGIVRDGPPPPPVFKKYEDKDK